MDSTDLELDYFHIYQTRSVETPLEIGLQGQFDRRRTKAKLAFVDWFANAAGKNREPIFDKSAHLNGYRLHTTDEAARSVDVEDQFGRRTLTIGNGMRLLVPAKKRGVASEQLDHYKVYAVLRSDGPLNKTVKISDQFGTAEVILRHPVGFGVPVKKTHEGTLPIHNDKAHLTLFAIEPAKGDKPVEYTMRALRIADQFTARSVGSFRSILLAVPGLKRSWK